MQELVYKQGQAGVTKASVSVTFNNEDRSRSPVGYEHCDRITVTRQIVIGGKNKYMINGATAQPTRVQNLFHSVQLNVNNPHFLIMQGRITKVLNMKPPEILGMLEEAAGTRMYENKKEGALKTLDKKQTKVDEIDRLLEEEILPTIEKLRKERGDYMKWAAANDNLERLRRFCIAYDFVKAQEAVEEANAGTSSIEEQIADCRSAIDDANRESTELELHTQRLQAEKEERMGGEMKELVTRTDALSKELVKENTAWTNKKNEVKGEQKAKDKLLKVADEMEAAEAKRAEKVATLEAEAADEAASLAEKVAAADMAERTLQGVQSGKGTGADKSLQAQLADAVAAQSTCDAEVKSAALKIKHVEKELTTAKKTLGTKQKEGDKLTKELQTAESAVDAARANLANFGGCTSEKAKELEGAADKASAEVQDLQQEVDVLNATLSACDFQFRDPEAKFDRSRVKGVVAKLMRVKDPVSTTALEVIAGGKLHQVVVDTEVTGKALLAKGQLKKRVTIIPLNKIKSQTASDHQIAAAKNVSNGEASIALSLVTYDEDVQNVMKYVFGKAFVCKNQSTAKSVAYNRDVMLKCVTVEGDLFNPDGVISGGSRSQGGSVLTKLNALYKAENSLAQAKSRAKAAMETAKAAMKEAKEAQKLEDDLDRHEHALGLLKERVSGSEVHQLAEKVTKFEQELADAKKTTEDAKVKKVEAEKSAKALAQEIKNFEKERDSRLKEAEKALKQAKEAVTKARAQIKEKEEFVTNARVEKEAAMAERAALDEQISAADASIAELQTEADSMEKDVAEKQKAYDVVAAELDERRARVAECDKEISNLLKRKSKLENVAMNQGVEMKKLEHKITRLEKEAEDAKTHVEHLHKEHQWISSEMALFGQAGGDYDFKKRSPTQAQAELADCEEAQATLGKRVNKKVIAMFDKAESEFKDLQEKRRIVLNDRTKIQKVITELDEKKREALQLTWEKVTKDFGSIFSTLLPGTSAKLEPPEGGTVMDGLEVKVAFGEVWKESLSELSGGQRSLLALSLILALLLFKPAPIYILDEVDAALDLSHTQNIGRMIKQHFPFSQFLVVSLKEGMFNNANVIFRTKFVDGNSTVTRTVPALKDKQDNTRPDEPNALAEAASKRRGAATSGKGKEN